MCAAFGVRRLLSVQRGGEGGTLHRERAFNCHGNSSSEYQWRHFCALPADVLPLEGKEPENYNSLSLCSGNLLSLLHSMLCYKIFMSLSINDYWQLSAAVAVYVALQRSRSINRNWNTSQGFPKRMPQATIASIFPQSEGRARWAISPHCRETNGQIKKHRQKATAQEQRQRQSSIDLKRNSSEVLTANYTKRRTSRSPRAIMKLPPTLLSITISNSNPNAIHSNAMQSNIHFVCFSSSQRGRNAKMSNKIFSNGKILNKCKGKQWIIKYKTS